VTRVLNKNRQVVGFCFGRIGPSQRS